MAPRVFVVIPCYRARTKILDVLCKIGPEVERIIVIDDGCPEQSGSHVMGNCHDPRVHVSFHDINQGVGGAVITGYRWALEGGADICVKLDADGQMDPGILPDIVAPIVNGLADYSKGNRFYYYIDTRSMPNARMFGNIVLSFITKLSSGYWNIFDPTNGYTAIHRLALERLPLDRVDRRFFFESDMLFRLYLLGVVVADVPMRAVYADEQSSLRVSRVILPFLAKNMRNFGKRILYRYFLRDLNIASLELVFGLLLLAFGTLFGATKWIASASQGEAATAGVVMLAGLPVLAGLQMLLGFFAFDSNAVPRVPLQNLLASWVTSAASGRLDNKTIRPR